MNQMTAPAETHDSNYVGKVLQPDLSGTDYSVVLDTLSFTIGADQFKRIYGISCFSKIPLERLQSCFQDYMRSILCLPFELLEVRGRRNFFNYSIPFVDDLGFIAFGGNNISKKLNPKTGQMEQVQNEEKIQFYITGNGCSVLDKRNFKALYKSLSTLSNVCIKRVDIALDCFDGSLSIDHAESLYDSGEFNSNGRPPKANRICKKNDDSGETFYVGSRISGKIFRAYEKGKQLGDKLSPWVRFEVEIHSSQREIPLDVLINPVAYFSGSYPALNFASACQFVIRTVKNKLKIQADQLVVFARTGYGRLIYFLVNELGYTPEQIVNNLSNHDGYPKRLRWVAHI